MKKLLLSAFVICLAGTSIAQESPLWMRHCALSPDGTTIAFTYKGDIYTVPSTGGRATQITTNTDKHGNITYSFYVNGIALTAQVVVNLSAGSNYANATVYPMMNGNNLTFSGTLVPTSQSGIFRSGFISY